MVNGDLIVVADYAPLFKVENFVGNEDSFAGVQVGNDFIETGDLLN